MSALTNADEHALETLARLQLAAQRMGTSIQLRNASAQLVDLLALFGLEDVLPVVECGDGADSGFEVDGETEEREQVRVDEEVDRGDTAV